MKQFTFSIIVIMICLAGCKPEFDKPCRDVGVQQTFSLTSRELSVFPYGSNDTIGFSGNLGDTVYFITDTLLAYNTFLPSSIIGNPECPRDNDAYAARKTFFNSNNSIQLQAFIQKSNDSIGFVINGNSGGMPIGKVGDSTFQFRDSVIYGNRTFYKTHDLVLSSGDRIVVNSTYGLLYFTINGRIYTLFKFNSK